MLGRECSFLSRSGLGLARMRLGRRLFNRPLESGDSTTWSQGIRTGQCK